MTLLFPFLSSSGFTFLLLLMLFMSLINHHHWPFYRKLQKNIRI